jgi:hypothetical protein
MTFIMICPFRLCDSLPIRLGLGNTVLERFLEDEERDGRPKRRA